jgi:hypothetical protein
MGQGFTSIFGLISIFLGLCVAAARAQTLEPLIATRVNKSQPVSLEGNTPPAALRAENDRGPVADSLHPFQGAYHG